MKDETVYIDLIQLTLSGNKEAYSELYDKMIQEVYKTAHFIYGSINVISNCISKSEIEWWDNSRRST